MSKEVKVLWLSQEEVIKAGAWDMDLVLEQVRKVNKWLVQDKINEANLLRVTWDKKLGGSRKIGIHGAIINSEEMQIAGVKSIPANPDNPVKYGMPRSNGLLTLYNYDTGLPICVMDDKIVSDQRTGAGSALGAEYGANPDSEILGLIGCGPIQDAHILATSKVMHNIKTCRVYDLRREKAEAFAQRWEKLGYKFEIVNSCPEAIADADIAYTCTSGIAVGDEYVPPEWVKKGSFHSPGSIWDYKPETVLTAFNKYGMDFVGRLEDKGFPFADLTMEGKLDKEKIAVIGRVLLSQEKLRTSPTDTIYYETLGICATDIAINYVVYNRAKEMGLGTEVYLWHEPAYF